MHILEYHGLDTAGLADACRKVIEHLARGDWHAAQVRKLAPTPYYRARLDERNRLLFKLMRHGDQTCVLVLEVIRNHAYEKSRFLRGTPIDESRIPELSGPAEPHTELEVLAHLPREHRRFHALDKLLSFDDAQEAVLNLPPPLIVVGSAGSGKTALTLEKMKQLRGDVLYVTQSAYLAEHARKLYFGLGFEPQDQQPEFLALRELIETIAVPAGREITFADFGDFLRRHAQAVGKRDGHMLYEEFRGVLVGTSLAAPHTSREAYLALGLRQSIYPPEDRAAIYMLFERHLGWMAERGLYDPSAKAQQYLARATPRYDHVVVDEVQDLTMTQLALILRGLKTPGQFLLCGDANQIVHPNFFSWARVKSLFHQNEELAERSVIHVLRSNYRNAVPVTRLANRLIKLKQRRFGSIDRESNFLVEAIAAREGGVSFLADQEALRRELDDKTRHSTRFAVIVLRDEHKEEARRHFRTPLVFSVQEAKGLEYEHIILFRLISSSRTEYAEIAEGVARADLDGEELSYARGKDKSDKSVEVYKFFVNALYVAVTRAVRELYVIESDMRHPLLGLLELDRTKERLDLAQQKSSLEDWSREARRLELQGRQEQADQIRSSVLKLQAVPWSVVDADTYPKLRASVLDPKNVSSKLRQQALEYAGFYAEPELFQKLSGVPADWPGDPTLRAALHRSREGLLKKHAGAYLGRNFKDVLAQTERYGIDFRNPFKLTPLMLAAIAGNGALAEALLARGANPDLTDNYGRNAFQLFVADASGSGPAFTEERFIALYRCLAPGSVSIRVDHRLYKLDPHTIEFLLFHLMLAQTKHRLQAAVRGNAAFDTQALERMLAAIPFSIWPEERRRRQYLSGVLSRNEHDRDYAYNRRIFMRMRQGRYMLNPRMDVKLGERWVNLCELLSLSLIALDADRYVGGEMIERMVEQSTATAPLLSVEASVEPEDDQAADEAADTAVQVPEPAAVAPTRDDPAPRAPPSTAEVRISARVEQQLSLFDPVPGDPRDPVLLTIKPQAIATTPRWVRDLDGSPPPSNCESAKNLDGQSLEPPQAPGGKGGDAPDSPGYLRQMDQSSGS